MEEGGSSKVCIIYLIFVFIQVAKNKCIQQDVSKPGSPEDKDDQSIRASVKDNQPKKKT